MHKETSNFDLHFVSARPKAKRIHLVTTELQQRRVRLQVVTVTLTSGYNEGQPNVLRPLKVRQIILHLFSRRCHRGHSRAD